jgi:hypothetical protein
MSSTTSTASKARGPAGPKLPEEKFWIRYSAHGEAPLSVAGSVALHALAFGGLILYVMYLSALLFKPVTSIPVEPVRLAIGGGGGGAPSGTATGTGQGAQEDVPSTTDREEQKAPEEGPPRPKLDPVIAQKVQQKFEPDSFRYISESRSEMARAFAQLDDSVRRKLTDGLAAAKGSGGSGTGGSGTGGGGTGDGGVTSDGKSRLSKRERRMLRWHMTFDARSGSEYLHQLRGLGAILAFPVREGSPPEYQLVRDLRRGGRLLSEDLSRLNRIYWIDNKPNSVRDIVAELGLQLPFLPSHFVAFMPEELEAKLFQLERNYVEKVLRQPFNEDAIDETLFKVVRTSRGYQPEMVRVILR